MTESTLVPFANAGTGLISREELSQSLNNAAMSIPTSNSGVMFLKMDKGNGEWIFGQEEVVVDPKSLWAINPASFKHGYVCWDSDSGGAPVQEIMVPISRALPSQDQLPDIPTGLKYQQQRSVEITCISGEGDSDSDFGVVCEYKQSSVGAMKLFGVLTNGLLAQLDKDPDRIVAIVTLGSDTYKHKKYGRINNPIWEVKEWRTLDDMGAPEARAEEPVKNARAKATKVEEPVEEQDDDVEAEYAEAEAEAETSPRRRVRR